MGTPNGGFDLQGRPRKENPRHRGPSAKPGTPLPGNGRQGPPPEWPLPEVTDSELTVWAKEWASPQAVMWEEQGLERMVARYVRYLIQVETRDPSTRLATEVRQLEDRLLKNPLALARSGYSIGPKVEEEPTKADVSNIEDYRNRVG